MTEYDPLETFARIYYEGQGYFVQTNIFFGFDEIDLIAMTPNQNEIIVCFCITTTMKPKVEDFDREYIKTIKKAISRQYNISRRNISLHYFTLWLGGTERTINERSSILKKMGFSKIIGPKEISAFVDSIVEKYDRLWEEKGREGPREIEPILWTIKMLWRIGYFK